MSSDEEKDQYKPKLPNFKDILEVKHSIPGRIRIQCKVLKDNPHGKQALLNTFSQIPGITEISINPYIGTILIKYEEEFRKVINYSDKFVKCNGNSIITLGMKPSRAETGYGYIKYSKESEYSKENERLNFNQVIKVEAFIEKPNKEKAKEYLLDESYLWNSGMFIWSTNNILKQIKKFSPDTYNALKEIEDIDERCLKYLIKSQYKDTEAISIDYAVLEKSEDIYVVPSDFGWDDVGSWEALDRYREKDVNGNVYVGMTKAVDGRNNLLISSSHKVVVEGLSDIYVIENDGKILVGHKSNVANIKELKNIV